MPEGHTLRRLADDVTETFGGRSTRVSSPQGRFAPEAALLDGAVLDLADAAGKHLFLQFAGDRVVHIHLGLIGRLDLGRTDDGGDHPLRWARCGCGSRPARRTPTCAVPPSAPS